MTRIDRYLAREIAAPLAVGMALFFVVIAFAQVLLISDKATGLAVTTWDIVRALAYSLPPIMGILIPVSMFFATLLGLGRLASDRELVGLAGAGVSPYRLLRRPVLMASLLAAICCFTLVYGEPWGVRGLNELFKTSAQRALASGVRVGEFNQWLGEVTFMASAKDGEDLLDVVFADRRNAERPLVLSARRGRVVTGDRASDIVFDLEDGAIVVQDQHSDLLRVLHFEKSRYRLDVESVGNRGLPTVSRMQGLPIHSLWYISNDPATHSSRRVSAAVVMHRRAALPLATVVFTLLAVPLAMRSTSGARARGFLYSAAIVGVYYYLGRAFELLARKHIFSIHLAAWMPNLIALVFVAVLVWSMRRYPR